MMLKLMVGFPGDLSGKECILIDKVETLRVCDYWCHSLADFNKMINEFTELYGIGQVICDEEHWREAHKYNDAQPTRSAGSTTDPATSASIPYRLFRYMRDGRTYIAINNYPTYVLNDEGKTVEKYYAGREQGVVIVR